MLLSELTAATTALCDSIDRFVDAVLGVQPRAWICAAISDNTHPYRITDGQQDLGHYATIENARRALAELS